MERKGSKLNAAPNKWCELSQSASMRQKTAAVKKANQHWRAPGKSALLKGYPP